MLCIRREVWLMIRIRNNSNDLDIGVGICNFKEDNLISIFQKSRSQISQPAWWNITVRGNSQGLT